MAKKGQKFRHYSQEIKLKAVQDYIRTKASLLAVCNKYNIASPETVLKWTRIYRKEGINGFLERRGKATKASSPFKGRPRKYFETEEEQKKYQNERAEYDKNNALQREKIKIQKQRIR